MAGLPAGSSSFSDYFENGILQWFKASAVGPFVGATTGMKTTLYVGLFLSTGMPPDAGTSGAPQDGTELTAVAGIAGFTSYARSQISSSAWTGPVAAGEVTGQQISNTPTLPFTLSNWTNSNTVASQTVGLGGVGIWDASTAGNLLFYIPLGSTMSLGTNVGFQILPNSLIIIVD